MPFATVETHRHKRLRSEEYDAGFFDALSYSSMASPPVCSTPSVSSTTEEERSDSSVHSAVTSPGSFLDSAILHDALSKFQLSYTDLGLNMEARISNVSDLRSLIDAFSKLCRDDYQEEKQCQPVTTNSAVLYRNRNFRTKPVNFFSHVCGLGQIVHPHSKHGTAMSLRQIVDACVDTYFSCWVRYTPILRKDEFMAWYKRQHHPTETLIVNAMCSFVFRHLVTHHPRPELAHFCADQDQLQEQEEFFFDRARDLVGQSFDTPDRYAIVGLLFMACRAENSRAHHYTGMAVSALQELEIYPRTVLDTDDTYDKEMDTRLWWFVWSIDFYLYSGGAPKNTPQARPEGVEVDLPRIFEQDIDEAEIGVLAHIHCLKLWRIQASIIQTLYEHDTESMTVDQLADYDARLVAYHQSLPPYLRFDSGFEYGCEDLFLACVRVNLEYNASRIILHKLFIPEPNDSHPTELSLHSLNVCLSTALLQLRTLKTCNKIPFGRCAFDRDELWRAAEVISTAMDVYRACASPIILRGIDRDEYEQGLHKALAILQDTRDYQQNSKNWIQVADWIELEIRRHQLYYAHPLRQKEQFHQQPADYFLANLKPTAADKYHHARETHPAGSMLSVLSFPQTKAFTSPSPASLMQSTLPPRSSTSTFSASPSSSSSTSSSSRPRFRYFNPRNTNKFLFIDENPTS